MYELPDEYYKSSENLNRIATKFETQFKTSEYERLKLSSTVSSLEVAHLNLSKSKCGKFDLRIKIKYNYLRLFMFLYSLSIFVASL